MKSVKIAALAATLLLSGSAKASLIDASVFGGYATFAPADLNSQIDSYAASNSTTGTKITSGYYVGAQGLFTVMPALKIGPRINYLATGDGKVGTTAINGKDLLLEVGVGTDWSLPLTGLGVSAGVFAGYGMGTMSIVSPGSTTNYTGGGFAAEVVGQARYSIFGPLSLALDLGYRLANVSQVKDDKGNLWTKTSSTEAAPVDFSGLNVGGGLVFNF